MKESSRFSTLLVIVFVIIVTIAFLEYTKPKIVVENITPLERAEKSLRYQTAKEITTPDGFINTDSITISDLIGKKVILIDFWTYTCINCQRTFPFLSIWYEKYKDQGLEIIGVHTPEFEFEKEYNNVQDAVNRFKLEYPIVLDNDFSTWHAYQNRYWPRKYLIDIDGYIVYDHIGEGGYRETELKIQELLKERAERLSISDGIEQPLTSESFAEVARALSPEIYFGAAQNSELVNGVRYLIGYQSLEEPTTINNNSLYLTGNWLFQPEFAKNQKSGDQIIFNYTASKVFMVLSPENAPVKVKVLLDDSPIPENIAGDDIVYENGESYFIVNAQRLYKIINDSNAYTHTLKFIMQDPGVEAFTFTFG